MRLAQQCNRYVTMSLAAIRQGLFHCSCESFADAVQDLVWPVSAQQPDVYNIDRNDGRIPWTSGNAPSRNTHCCT